MAAFVTSKVIKFSLRFVIVIIVTPRQLLAYEAPVGSRQLSIFLFEIFLVRHKSEAYSEQCQISKMERFAKIVNA